MTQQNTVDQMISIKNRYSDDLSPIPGVIGFGVGQGTGGAVLQIHVTDDDPALPERLPKQLEGVPIEIVTHPAGFKAF